MRPLCQIYGLQGDDYDGVLLQDNDENRAPLATPPFFAAATAWRDSIGGQRISAAVDGTQDDPVSIVVNFAQSEFLLVLGAQPYSLNAQLHEIRVSPRSRGTNTTTGGWDYMTLPRPQISDVRRNSGTSPREILCRTSSPGTILHHRYVRPPRRHCLAHPLFQSLISLTVAVSLQLNQSQLFVSLPALSQRTPPKHQFPYAFPIHTNRTTVFLLESRYNIAFGIGRTESVDHVVGLCRAADFAAVVKRFDSWRAPQSPTIISPSPLVANTLNILKINSDGKIPFEVEHPDGSVYHSRRFPPPPLTLQSPHSNNPDTAIHHEHSKTTKVHLMPGLTADLVTGDINAHTKSCDEKIPAEVAGIMDRGTDQPPNTPPHRESLAEPVPWEKRTVGVVVGNWYPRRT
ncbi:hypothetical protein BDZ89DRAFT_1146364 [Hymenopellis radicata]|nr:hypothetical protein BDZ89DRAFT_1146364 [Hymenopellis radicata]